MHLKQKQDAVQLMVDLELTRLVAFFVTYYHTDNCCRSFGKQLSCRSHSLSPEHKAKNQQTKTYPFDEELAIHYSWHIGTSCLWLQKTSRNQVSVLGSLWLTRLLFIRYTDAPSKDTYIILGPQPATCAYTRQNQLAPCSFNTPA